MRSVPVLLWPLLLPSLPAFPTTFFPGLWPLLAADLGSVATPLAWTLWRWTDTWNRWLLFLVNIVCKELCVCFIPTVLVFGFKHPPSHQSTCTHTHTQTHTHTHTQTHTHIHTHIQNQIMLLWEDDSTESNVNTVAAWSTLTHRQSCQSQWPITDVCVSVIEPLASRLKFTWLYRKIPNATIYIK